MGIDALELAGIKCQGGGISGAYTFIFFFNQNIQAVIAGLVYPTVLVQQFQSHITIPGFEELVKATGFCKGTTGDVALLVGKSEVGGDEADAVGVWRALVDERGWFGEVAE